jgi:Clostripain family.
MKQYLISATLFGLMVLMTACSKDDVPATRGGDAANAKTILIYMAGKNDLSYALERNLKQIKEGSKHIGENDNLLVFVRRNNGLEEPWLARIKSGVVTDSMSLSNMGITSSDDQSRACDPIVMEGVLRYAFSHYPAMNGNYGLVLWGHGSGWLIEQEVTPKNSRRGFGVDVGDNNSNDRRWINITTMANILKELPHMKFIMGDCCCLMCLENLYELRNTCDYIIGSPAEIPYSGAPYDQIVPDFFADGKFYTDIIDKYYSNIMGNLPLTAVKTSEMDNLAQVTRQTLQAVKEKIGNGYADMTGLIHYYHTDKQDKFFPEYNIFYDAGDYIRTYAPEAVYQQWRQALDRTVIDSRMATKWNTDKPWSNKYSDFTVTKEKFHGVSMFVSQDPSRGNYARYNEDIKQMAWYETVGGI